MADCLLSSSTVISLVEARYFLSPTNYNTAQETKSIHEMSIEAKELILRSLEQSQGAETIKVLCRHKLCFAITESFMRL